MSEQEMIDHIVLNVPNMAMVMFFQYFGRPDERPLTIDNLRAHARRRLESGTVDVAILYDDIDGNDELVDPPQPNTANKPQALQFTAPPWLTNRSDEGLTVAHDTDGNPIGALMCDTQARPAAENNGNAHLMGFAAELFVRLDEADALMRRTDPEYCACNGLEQVSDDEWEAALDEIGAFLEIIKEGP